MKSNSGVRKSSVAFLLITAILLGNAVVALASVPKIKSSSLSSKSAAGVSDAIVLDWIEIARQQIFPNGPPFEAARRMAMVQVAVFEAVNAVSGKYEPYLGTVSAPAGASPEAAAIVASWGILDKFYGPNNPGLANLKTVSLNSISNGQSK